MKDGGKEREEETEVDDETKTLEEIGNRNEVDDVHRCKRVSTSPLRQIARFTSSPRISLAEQLLQPVWQ